LAAALAVVRVVGALVAFSDRGCVPDRAKDRSPSLGAGSLGGLRLIASSRPGSGDQDDPVGEAGHRHWVGDREERGAIAKDDLIGGP
jgi:hypothetical protein